MKIYLLVEHGMCSWVRAVTTTLAAAQAIVPEVTAWDCRRHVVEEIGRSPWEWRGRHRVAREYEDRSYSIEEWTPDWAVTEARAAIAKGW